MPLQRKRKKRAVLQTDDLRRIRAAAKAIGAREHALIEWLYTNGARASEPGLARLDDLDLHNGTVLLTHLKGGLAAEPMPLSSTCLAALKKWLPVHADGVAAEAIHYVFPSEVPIACYPCGGTKTVVQKRRKRKDGEPEAKTVPCPHCHATGMRWGITRHEVSRIIKVVFTAANIPEEFHFPHVLRHSAVTHLLDNGVAPPAIQERVGHQALATTFGYMHATKKARAMVNKTFDENVEEDEEP